MPDVPFPARRPMARPKHLLTSNSNLRPHGIANWTIPALVTKLPDGRTVRTCPNAGICARLCYARAGAYRFSNVLAKHQQNLAYVLDDPAAWTEQMIREIGRRRARPVDCPVCSRSDFPIKVRIHDAGDFFSDDYALAWLDVIGAHPGVLFYAYTKEVELARRLFTPNQPANFLLVYSYGGKQDVMLDPARDRVCDVFPDVEALRAAGYHDQAACDLLAVLGPTPVGMAANNIPHLLNRLGDRTFRDRQQQSDLADSVRQAARTNRLF